MYHVELMGDFTLQLSASSIDIPGPNLFIAKIDTLRTLDGLCYQWKQCLLQNYTYLPNDAIQN